MFMPAPTSLCSDSRTSAAGETRATASGGSQLAPRQNTGTSLTDTVNPPASRSADTVRNATAGSSTTVSPTSRRTSVRGWAPWVCGHHRSTRGSLTRASTTDRPS